MYRDNFWFQLAIFSIFILGGLFYTVRGSKRKDRKASIVGMILFTFAWTKFVLLLEPYNFNPILKKILSISEVIVPLSGIIIAAIYEKKWRPIFLGIIFLGGIFFGIAWIHASYSSSKISDKTSTPTQITR